MSRWFRFYDDVINDPKVISLSEAMRWHWVALLCVASKGDGNLPALKHIALHLRLTEQRAAAVLAELHQAGLLDKTEAGFRPHNWDGRQFKSDVSNERVKRYRQRKGNVSCNVTVTTPDTDADAETENSEPIGSGAEAPSDPRKRLFTEGLATVRRLTGRGEDSARALIGKWLGQASDEATVVLGLIDDADRNQVANLTSWIVPRLKEQRQIGEPINVDWDAQVARFKRGIGWSAKWYGPEPGQYGCRAPPDVLEKYGYRQADGAIA